MRRHRRPLAALFAVLALASTIQTVTAPPPPRVSVLVAAHDLASGVRLRPEDLTEVRFDPGSVPDALAVDAVGRVLAAPLRRGEVVSDVRLVGAGLSDGYPGLTAMPVRLPDAGMVELLRVGDLIDVLGADPRGHGVEVVVAGVPVLAIPEASSDPGPTGLSGRLIVVGVDPAQVPRLAEAAVGAFLSVAFTR